ncbi:MAG: glycoside hydrolase family 57 protein [Candidatus Bathyarchaeia archaeon]
MVDILLLFEVHQPYRFKRDFFWGKREFQKRSDDELFEYYFDHFTDGEIFKRASAKCYLPSNSILLEQIDQFKHEKKEVKVAFSISGVFLEQCERFNKDVLDSFKQLSETGRVEFLGQTYYHSLSSLYPRKDEFIAQVNKHRNTVNELLGHSPKVFENTELIYNNEVAKLVEQLGFNGICTEGADRIIGSSSPNRLLSANGCKELRVILRNYKLTDDVGFRFSTKTWSEWPLTAEKYAGWLASADGQYVCIFLDYETFGEHHWPETGIHDFLRRLPGEILKKGNLRMSTPSRVVEDHKPVGLLDVPESKTVSWADIERSTDSWIGNDMQWAFFEGVRDIEMLVREADDKKFTDIWRYLQISDHLYYMFTAGGGPGVVHSYFSPYAKPIDSFLTSIAILMDFENRLKIETFAANEQFEFQTFEGKSGSTGLSVLSLVGFHNLLAKVPQGSIEFHRSRGDFENWFELSLRDKVLADKVRKVNESDLEGKAHVLELRKVIQSHITFQKMSLRKMGYS